MPDHKEQRVQVCADLLEWYETIISLTASSLEAKPGYTITNQIKAAVSGVVTQEFAPKKFKAQPSAGRRLRMMTSRQ
jgi:hypothetical protein